jgi:hypothetical protein
MDCFNKIPNKYEYPFSKKTIRYNYNGKKYSKYIQNTTYIQNTQIIIKFIFHNNNEKLETVYENKNKNKNKFCIIS